MHDLPHQLQDLRALGLRGPGVQLSRRVRTDVRLELLAVLGFLPGDALPRLLIAHVHVRHELLVVVDLGLPLLLDRVQEVFPIWVPIHQEVAEPVVPHNELCDVVVVLVRLLDILDVDRLEAVRVIVLAGLRLELTFKLSDALSKGSNETAYGLAVVLATADWYSFSSFSCHTRT